MSNRERWVVYPLLFLAICLGAKDHFPGMQSSELIKREVKCDVLTATIIKGENVTCNNLQANSTKGEPQIVLGQGKDGGQLVVYGPDERPTIVLGVIEDAGAFEASDFGGAMLRLRATKEGGRLEVEDIGGNIVGVQNLPLGVDDLLFEAPRRWIPPTTAPSTDGKDGVVPTRDESVRDADSDSE
jgi:hypothetical protein